MEAYKSVEPRASIGSAVPRQLYTYTPTSLLHESPFLVSNLSTVIVWMLLKCNELVLSWRTFSYIYHPRCRRKRIRRRNTVYRLCLPRLYL